MNLTITVNQVVHKKRLTKVKVTNMWYLLRSAGAIEKRMKRWEEDDDSGAHATFKAAIAAVYELIPTLPRPQPKLKGKLQPLSHMPGDLETDDKSLYRFFPESPLVKECLSQIHELWWDKPTDEANLTEPKNLPANAMFRPADLRKLPLAGFKDVFYRDPNAFLPLDPPEVGQPLAF